MKTPNGIIESRIMYNLNKAYKEIMKYAELGDDEHAEKAIEYYQGLHRGIMLAGYSLTINGYSVIVKVEKIQK